MEETGFTVREADGFHVTGLTGDGLIVGALGERVFVGNVVFAAGLFEIVDLTVGRLEEGDRVGILVGFVGPDVERLDGALEVR